MKYFDYAATTPLDEEILDSYTKLLKNYFANSESMHPMGLEVHDILEQSRLQTASLLRVKPEEIIYTSGASEANTMAVKGVAFAYKQQGMKLITTKIEHSSVLHAFEQLERDFGYQVTYLDVDENGVISLEQLKNAMSKDTILVSVMMVNNEVGTIEPIEEVKKILKEYPACKLHVDCVQAMGKIPVDFTGVDLATMSAHKLHGLKGSGILVKKSNIRLTPLINGGQQELGLRGGTTDACTQIMFAKTLRLALQRQKQAESHIRKLNTFLRDKLSGIEHIVMNSPEDASPYILSFSCTTLPSEPHRNALAAKGFCVSSVSTCGSKSLPGSYVLEAMGKEDDVIHGVIRISLDERITMEDAAEFVEAVKENVKQYGV
ncbi:MAG: cysteine desulfurase [Erysipelotrichaceae bacterium]|nr:cysteine desulfurase [Erysipelotrichaceae bacterium]